jgi:hypothetical protein
MNQPQFEQFWNENFPESPSINHLFKEKLTDRWLRIHSLPDDKRYAETAEEWSMLTNRQFTVFADLMPEKAKIYVILQLFAPKNEPSDHAHFFKNDCFRGLKFTKLTPINYFEITQSWADEDLMLQFFLAEIDPNSMQFLGILSEIARDQMRAFFISKKERRIIAPYDGGVDLVFENRETMLFYREKYRDWLPKS